MVPLVRGCALLILLTLPLLALAIHAQSSEDINVLLPGFNSSIFEPEPEAEAIVVQLSRKYIPIFLFDRDAGEYCFPDDKRQHIRLSGTCNSFSRSAYVFVNAQTCGGYEVYQYNLWFGLQQPCIALLPAKQNDSTYVQVWTNSTDGKVEKVRYSQHGGYYFRKAGSGVELIGNRTVVYIGRNSHGTFHQGCSSSVLNTGTKRCIGGCSFWEDYRRPDGKYSLDRGTLVPNRLTDSIDCSPGECRPGHSFWRDSSNSSCYGVFN